MTATFDENKDKAAKMPRNEINSEVAHCWGEQEKMAADIALLVQAIKINIQFCDMVYEGQIDSAFIYLRSKNAADQLRNALQKVGHG